MQSFETEPDAVYRLWLLGFAIFISSNVLGSVFQLASLSIVILAPLGAVSLLWNAFFARILLGDVFSRYLVMGTILIAGGAVLIAIFGVVPETTHSLPELLQLYRRPSFIVWISLQFAIILAVLGIAHWQERRLEARLQDVYIALPTSDDELEAGFASPLTPIQTPRSNVSRPKKVRRWSTPPAYLNLNGESGDSRPDPPSRPVTPATTRTAAVPSSRSTAGSRHVSFGANQYRSPTVSSIISESQSKRSVGASQKERSSIRPRLPQDRAEKMRIWLGIAFGSASGTMSGLCLLFAKTGVELLVLTVMGDNQFKRWESWMIVLALLICALLQVSRERERCDVREALTTFIAMVPEQVAALGWTNAYLSAGLLLLQPQLDLQRYNVLQPMEGAVTPAGRSNESGYCSPARRSLDSQHQVLRWTGCGR